MGMLRCAGGAGGGGQETSFISEGSGTAKACILGLLIKIRCSQVTRFFF